MKVSNETKVGALTALAITVLILGFNFLKGKNITDRNHTLYAVFPDVEGLVVASPVVANGLQVGRVYELDALDENMKGILVTINLAKNINIPVNSYATLSRTLLGTTSVKLMLGNSTEWVKEGDTLQAKSTPDLLTNVKNSLDPAMQNINNTLAALETVIQKLNNVLDPKTQNNLQSLIANLNTSSASLTALVNVQKGKLAQSLDHVEKITGTLASNKEQIDATLHHLEDITEKMAQANLKETIAALQNTLKQLETTLSLMNNKGSSVGALLNDRKLYDEIRQTNRSLTTLLDDLKTHPKRYLNFSVFGKKEKSPPLKSPLYDSSANKDNK